MIDTVGTPQFIYPVIILEIEEKLINIDGSDMILSGKGNNNQWKI